MSIKNYYKYIFLIISILFLCNSVHALVNPSSNRTLIWGNAGFGTSTVGSLSATYGLTLQSGNMIYGLRSTSNAEKAALFSEGDIYYDIGLLVGLGTGSSDYHVSIAAGIARVTGEIESETSNSIIGKDVKEIEPTMGIPVEAKLFLKFGANVGLGTILYTNINETKTFGGITFNLVIGALF